MPPERGRTYGVDGKDRWRTFRSRIAVPYQFRLEQAAGPALSILDVGCGDDSPLKLFRRTGRRVGVDAYEPAINRSREAGIHDEYRLSDVLRIGELFPRGSFEVVVAFDVLEHLERQDGLRLLAAMEQIAARRVVVFTPNGFVSQGERGGNPWQVHRSGWTPGALRQLGYQVSGVHGLRMLRGEEAQVRWQPHRFWHLVSDLSEPVVARFPALAYQVIAAKDTNP